MNIETFLLKLQNELEIESNPLQLETQLNELDEWDSMTALLLIDFVSKEFNVILDAEELMDLTSIESLIELIGKEKFM